MVLDLTISVEGGNVESRAKDNVLEARFPAHLQGKHRYF